MATPAPAPAPTVADDRTYACHVSAMAGDEPDGCVLDYGVATDCDHGVLPSGRLRRSKLTCAHWRRVS